MALVPCRECQQEVSDQVRTCPHCGAPLPAQSQEEYERTKKATNWLLGTLFATTIGFLPTIALIILILAALVVAWPVVVAGGAVWLIVYALKKRKEQKAKVESTVE